MSTSREIKKRRYLKAMQRKREEEQKTGAPAQPTTAQSVAPSLNDVHRATLVASLSGRPFEDIKLFAFSRRRLDGRVDTPLPLFANRAHVHRVTDHFERMCSSGFLEGRLSDMNDPFPPDRDPSTDQYTYDEDSDLDDEELPDPTGPDELLERDGCSGKFSDRQKKKRRERQPDPQADTISDTVSDVDSAKHCREPENIHEAPNSIPKAPRNPGRVIHVEHIAHRTLQAFLLWTYLPDELKFAPLKSDRTSPAELDPLQCSPKSMYRLAHEYNITELKTRSLQDIKAKLSPENILDEAFSSFTALYDDVREMEMEVLYKHMGNPAFQRDLPKWLELLEKGELPQGSHKVFASLITRLCATSWNFEDYED